MEAREAAYHDQYIYNLAQRKNKKDFGTTCLNRSFGPIASAFMFDEISNMKYTAK